MKTTEMNEPKSNAGGAVSCHSLQSLVDAVALSSNDIRYGRFSPTVPKAEYAITEDDVCLALGRYRNEGAQPVILMHGLAQNYKVWDFPVENSNFAHYLFAKGYDVWLPCLRGHGDGHIQSEKPERPWNVDDLAIYDVPAILEKVTRSTGKKPIWIGHSLGGMIAYIYLLGVEYKKKVFQFAPGKEVSLSRISSSDSLCVERNNSLRALATVATPVAMKWNEARTWNEYRQIFWESNVVFPWLARKKWLRKIASHFKFLPTSSSFWKEFFRDKIGNSLVQKSVEKWVSLIANSPITSLFWYPPNMNSHLVQNLVSTTLNEISTPVLEQFADWVEHGTFRSRPQGEDETCVYNEHFQKIKVPLLVIAGNRDKIASHVTIQEGYCRMGSEDKTYHCFDQFGHDDLCMGTLARKVVHPFIEGWISRHRV